ncbi:hypothetical protein PV04_01109 [Phialophora macrospora]|uniref:GH16 domain-containing protein n=1 Tax=Phialophora macrospora TaxID=1851006 RepID=A0A0D2FWX8_9EURO|nr:hypothetical protein PV04_01109 [Phialophora macrospora]
MARLDFFPVALTILAGFLGSATADATPCNPLNVTAACPAIPGLTTNTYFMDFTQQTTTPPDWILADYAKVDYASPNGANFTIAKRHDAPYIWSWFYVHFGRIEVVMKVASGGGIITGAVMMSDDLDEIDWEFSGNNFGKSSGSVLTNYFGKGQIGWSDRGAYPAVDAPQDKFHTYALDWQPDRLTWSIDGVTVRSLNNNGATTGSYQYPQTPSRLHLGMWCAGDPDSAAGTVQWAGGYTNFSAAPFSAYVKSVRITTSNICSSYKYPYPFDGTYKSVQCSNQTVTLPCTYAVVAGDDGDKIAKNLTVNFDTLRTANPGVDWDKLLIGQVLVVPGGTVDHVFVNLDHHRISINCDKFFEHNDDCVELSTQHFDRCSIEYLEHDNDDGCSDDSFDNNKHFNHRGYHKPNALLLKYSKSYDIGNNHLKLDDEHQFEHDSRLNFYKQHRYLPFPRPVLHGGRRRLWLGNCKQEWLFF